MICRACFLRVKKIDVFLHCISTNNISQYMILTEEPLDKKKFLKVIIKSLKEGDWDTEQDSDYWDHPLVREVFKELYPHWFDEED